MMTEEIPESKPAIIVFEPYGSDLYPLPDGQSFGQVFGRAFPDVDVYELSDLEAAKETLRTLLLEKAVVPYAYFFDLPAFNGDRSLWDLGVELLKEHRALSVPNEPDPYIFLQNFPGAMHAAPIITKCTGFHGTILTPFKHVLCRHLATVDPDAGFNIADFQAPPAFEQTDNTPQPE